MHNTSTSDDGSIVSPMAVLLAKSGLPCCLMHNRKSDKYNDFITDYLDDNRLIIDCALKHGISKENIILDPGVGFAKSLEQNLIAINTLDKLCALGYPVLLRGASIFRVHDVKENFRALKMATAVIGKSFNA